MIRLGIRRTARRVLARGAGVMGYDLAPKRRRQVLRNVFSTAHPRTMLLSYLTQPFLDLRKGEDRLKDHTNPWECVQIARTFSARGFNVDVIDWDDTDFVPSAPYDVCIDIHGNLERLAGRLPAGCIKVLHITGAHWLFQNRAEYGRLLSLQQRRGVTLVPRRMAAPVLGIEHADCATILGNAFTQSTFRYAGKPITRIPISTPATFPWSEERLAGQGPRTFVWIGGAGMVHKGLDLTLEAFAGMPEHTLIVCGPVSQEPDFEAAYHRELHELPNVRLLDWVDVTGSRFAELARSSIAVVFPSCSEGGGGSAIVCMHAGMIPIVSAEASVDTGDFGVVLPESSVEEIRRAVRLVAGLPVDELRRRSRAAWEFAREHHTRENFAQRYAAFCDALLAGQEMAHEERRMSHV